MPEQIGRLAGPHLEAVHVIRGLVGDTVLVQGAGGVSILGLQLAKAAGTRVIVTSSSAAKRERALAMGADHMIEHNAEPRWATRRRRGPAGAVSTS